MSDLITKLEAAITHHDVSLSNRDSRHFIEPLHAALIELVKAACIDNASAGPITGPIYFRELRIALDELEAKLDEVEA